MIADASSSGEVDSRPTVVYKRFLDALNRQDLEAATRCVHVERYREDCVAYTKGFVDWEGAKASIVTIWKALPGLQVDLHELAEGPDYALARGTVRGRAEGRLYGAPATKRSFAASFFDYVKVEDGLIVERVQQSDVLGQMRQLYGRALGLVGVGAMFLRQQTPPTPQ
jgi:predicted ester cyclase